MTPEKRQRSPRGLIENVKKFRKWDASAQHPEELTLLLAEMSAQGDPITDYIRSWRRFAVAIIEDSGKNPADYRVLADSDRLDHVCTSARLIKQLDKIEACIGGLAARDPGQFRLTVYEALRFASFTHQSAIADNETSIWKGEEHKKTLRRNAGDRTDKAQRDRARYQVRANQLWEQHPKWPAKQVATVIESEERANREHAPEDKISKADTIRRLIRKK
jgi:hypothetical protein